MGVGRRCSKRECPHRASPESRSNHTRTLRPPDAEAAPRDAPSALARSPSFGPKPPTGASATQHGAVATHSHRRAVLRLRKRKLTSESPSRHPCHMNRAHGGYDKRPAPPQYARSGRLETVPGDARPGRRADTSGDAAVASAIRAKRNSTRECSPRSLGRDRPSGAAFGETLTGVSPATVENDWLDYAWGVVNCSAEHRRGCVRHGASSGPGLDGLDDLCFPGYLGRDYRRLLCVAGVHRSLLPE